jgi:drug/metabolite transporter (DMT)-like permease
MSATDITLLIVYAAGMSVGQVLFKLSANAVAAQRGQNLLATAITNGYFICAIVIYAAMTFLWVWILTRVALSRAYPFVVLSFVFTPFLAWSILNEPMGLPYVFAIALIMVGLLIIASRA